MIKLENYICIFFSLWFYIVSALTVNADMQYLTKEQDITERKAVFEFPVNISMFVLPPELVSKIPIANEYNLVSCIYKNMKYISRHSYKYSLTAYLEILKIQSSVLSTVNENIQKMEAEIFTGKIMSRFDGCRIVEAFKFELSPQKICTDIQYYLSQIERVRKKILQILSISGNANNLSIFNMELEIRIRQMVKEKINGQQAFNYITQFIDDVLAKIENAAVKNKMRSLLYNTAQKIVVRYYPGLNISPAVQSVRPFRVASSLIIGAAIVYHIVKDISKSPEQKYDEVKKRLTKAKTKYIKSKKLVDNFDKHKKSIEQSAVRSGFGGAMAKTYYDNHRKIVKEYIPEDLNMLLFAMQLKEKDFIELASKRPDFWREPGVTARILSLDDQKFGMAVLSMISRQHNRKSGSLKFSAFFDTKKHLQFLNLYPKAIKDRFIKLAKKYPRFYADIIANQKTKAALADYVGGSPLSLLND
jgi:hypothetical protein